MATALAASAAHADKVDGIKISLLDAARRSRCAASFPPGVRMYTGDDFNFAELILGDEQRPFRRPARHLRRHRAGRLGGAVGAGAGDVTGFRVILDPTVPLSRLVFAAPTRFYKTGVVFLAWLNGHQDHFTMIGGQQSARSIVHLARDPAPCRQGAPDRRSRAGRGAHAPSAGTHGIG